MMKSASAVAPLLAGLSLALLSLFPTTSPAMDLAERRADPRPPQLLQRPIPVEPGETLERPDRGRPQRVTPPPRPGVATQVIPGVTFLHRERSTEVIRRARDRMPGSEPRLPDGSPIIVPGPDVSR